MPRSDLWIRSYQRRIFGHLIANHQIDHVQHNRQSNGKTPIHNQIKRHTCHAFACVGVRYHRQIRPHSHIFIQLRAHIIANLGHELVQRQENGFVLVGEVQLEFDVVRVTGTLADDNDQWYAEAAN